jgi:hypothetical protein
MLKEANVKLLPTELKPTPATIFYSSTVGYAHLTRLPHERHEPGRDQSCGFRRSLP